MTLIVLRPSLAHVLGMGALSGILMTLIFAAGRLGGMTTVNLEMTLGSWMLFDHSALAWIVGLVCHLLISGLFALVYERVFRLWGGAGWRLGLAIGAAHALVDGILFSFLRILHPLAVERAIPVGGYFDFLGQMSLLVFLLAHLAFGAALGMLYQARMRAVPEEDVPMISDARRTSRAA